MHGQVKVARDVLEIDGVCGLPVALDRDGRRPGDLSMPSAGARAAVVRSAEPIDGFVRDARGGAAGAGHGEVRPADLVSSAPDRR